MLHVCVLINLQYLFTYQLPSHLLGTFGCRTV